MALISFFSHELQTCDWPRNVVCVSGKRNGEIFDTDDEDHERVPRLLVEDVNFGQRENVVPVSEKKRRPTFRANKNTLFLQSVMGHLF